MDLLAEQKENIQAMERISEWLHTSELTKDSLLALAESCERTAREYRQLAGDLLPLSSKEASRYHKQAQAKEQQAKRYRELAAKK